MERELRTLLCLMHLSSSAANLEQADSWLQLGYLRHPAFTQSTSSFHAVFQRSTSDLAATFQALKRPIESIAQPQPETLEFSTT